MRYGDLKNCTISMTTNTEPGMMIPSHATSVVHAGGMTVSVRALHSTVIDPDTACQTMNGLGNTPLSHRHRNTQNPIGLCVSPIHPSYLNAPCSRPIAGH